MYMEALTQRRFGKQRTGVENTYRKHITKKHRNSISTLIEGNVTTMDTTKIQATEQDSDTLILKRYLLVEYMSTPRQRTPEPIYNDRNEIAKFYTPSPVPTRSEIEAFCKEADIPVEHWTRWLRQVSFQDEVAGRSKDSVYAGAGAAQAYIALEAALSDNSLSTSDRAKIAATIAKLHLKHLEIITKLQVATAKGRPDEKTKNTLEAILKELKANREPKLIEATGEIVDVKDVSETVEDVETSQDGSKA